MIYLITGEMNSGKSTKLQEVYQEKNQGDGFVTVKKMEGAEVVGYDILKLSTKKSKPFIYRSFNLPDNVEIAFRIGDYYFSKSVLERVEKELEGMIKDKINPLYLDEIGLLELEGKCFYEVLKKIIKSGLDIYFTVREEYLERVIEFFSIEDHVVIKI